MATTKQALDWRDAILAIRKLEESVSYPVAAWLDHAYADDFREIVDTDLFENILEFTERADRLIRKVAPRSPSIEESWRTVSSLVRSLSEEGLDCADFTRDVGRLFFTVRTLREDLIQIAGVDDETLGSPVAPEFVERASLRLESFERSLSLTASPTATG